MNLKIRTDQNQHFYDWWKVHIVSAGWAHCAVLPARQGTARAGVGSSTGLETGVSKLGWQRLWLWTQTETQSCPLSHFGTTQGGRLQTPALLPTILDSLDACNCDNTVIFCHFPQAVDVNRVIFQNAIKLCESASASKWRKYWTKNRVSINRNRRIFWRDYGSFTIPRGECLSFVWSPGSWRVPGQSSHPVVRVRPGPGSLCRAEGWG